MGPLTGVGAVLEHALRDLCVPLKGRVGTSKPRSPSRGTHDPQAARPHAQSHERWAPCACEPACLSEWPVPKLLLQQRMARSEERGRAAAGRRAVAPPAAALTRARPCGREHRGAGGATVPRGQPHGRGRHAAPHQCDPRQDACSGWADLPRGPRHAWCAAPAVRGPPRRSSTCYATPAGARLRASHTKQTCIWHSPERRHPVSHPGMMWHSHRCACSPVGDLGCPCSASLSAVPCRLAGRGHGCQRKRTR